MPFGLTPISNLSCQNLCKSPRTYKLGLQTLHWIWNQWHKLSHFPEGAGAGKACGGKGRLASCCAKPPPPCTACLERLEKGDGSLSHARQAPSASWEAGRVCLMPHKAQPPFTGRSEQLPKSSGSFALRRAPAEGMGGCLGDGGCMHCIHPYWGG